MARAREVQLNRTCHEQSDRIAELREALADARDLLHESLKLLARGRRLLKRNRWEPGETDDEWNKNVKGHLSWARVWAKARPESNGYELLPDLRTTRTEARE